MNKLILAASARVQEPIHLLTATVLVAGMLAALAIVSAVASV